MASDHEHEHAHDPADDAAEAALAEMLDLDGVVLQAYWEHAITAVVQAADVGPEARVVDLGAGSGTGTFALAHQIADAQIVAVDSSPQMLRRIAAKAGTLGLTDRVRTVQADLDVDWPDLAAITMAPIDITWASMSLHHLVDPGRVLGHVLEQTRPGGIVAVAEFDEPLRFLPDELGVGRPGLEQPCLDALRPQHGEQVPHLGSDWTSQLEGAGWQVFDRREFAIALDPPPAGAVDYAAGWLQRMRAALADVLSRDNSATDERGTAGLGADDLAVLDVLLDDTDPRSVHRRDDLAIRGTRTLTLAR